MTEVGASVRLLEDQVAIVTGAGRGIGRAAARLFATQGARIVAADSGCDLDGTRADREVVSSVVDAIVSGGGRAVAQALDISNPGNARALVEAAVAAYGRVDLLVNCAGVARPQALDDIDETSWRAVLGAGLDAAFFCLQAVAPIMRAQGSGRIVNTTGLAGLLGAFGQASAAASAAGVYGVTRAAAMELECHGIAVNAVAPLAVTRQAPDVPLGADPASFSPEHVAPVILWLASVLSQGCNGVVVGVAGSRVSTYRMFESQGCTEAQCGRWAPEGLSFHWESIAKFRHQ
ncbi:SDR family NAD(P)-dependent oxidoreductase [Myxococcota bacterium]